MKKLAIGLFLLGLGCIGLYFVMGPNFSGDKEVKVMFNSNGGTNVTEQVLKSGEKAKVPETPTKDNSEFVEWQLDGNKYDFESIVNSDITLNAVWNDVVMYNVKLMLESNEYTTQVRQGSTISIDSFGVPAKDGYKIVITQESGELYDLSAPVNSDLTLNGRYEEIKKYKVTFNSNGGSKVDNVTVEEGSPVSEPTTTRDGYDFDGWYLNNDKYDFSNPVTSNITLKAKWKEKGKINVHFMVDDKEYKTVAVKEGTKVSKPTNPTKKKYRFVEWQLDGNKFDFSTKIESETTLTALFEEVSTYIVKFDTDGGNKIDDKEVEAGAKVKQPSNPTKSKYIFKEWQLNGKPYDFSKAVNSDITLKALWEREVRYTVKFISDSKEVDSQSILSGSKAKSISISKNGYKFQGWLYKNVPFDFTTPITENIELTAGWSRIEANDEQANPDIASDGSEGSIEKTE